MLRRIIGLTVRLTIGTVVAYQVAYKPWRRRWQADQEESTRLLPGDQLVPRPQFDQTMALTIDARPSAIWPWLLQMGFGRAGWYSYDALDMLGHSSRVLRPDLQELRAGQMLPLGPGLDFRVEVLDPERALVLYGDSRLMAPGRQPTETETPGLKLVGLLSDSNMSEFQVSWAFVLVPLEDGRTRLLERFRTRTKPGPATTLVAPLIDVGHFLMTRKHMLGVRERAEETPALTSHGAVQTEYAIVGVH
jgi:hypothetical protein